MSELKRLPCPACGEKNINVERIGEQVFCICPACGLRGPYIWDQHEMKGAAVIAAWNALPRVRQGIEDSLARAALQHYGLEHRMLQMQEELAEAMVAISHWRRGRNGCREEVTEELGDVLVVMAQLRVEFGREIDAWIMKKRERLACRIGYSEE